MSRLEQMANSVPATVFRRSAVLALLHSYEDFCRVKNAYLRRDEIVMKDNIYQVANSAVLVVASINQSYFSSDREIFKGYESYKKLPKHFETISTLRYGSLKGARLFREFLNFYVNLVRFCGKEGIRFPVNESIIREL